MITLSAYIPSLFVYHFHRYVNSITGVIVYGNGADLTTIYNAGNDSFEYFSEAGNLILSKNNNSLVAFFPSTGKLSLMLKNPSIYRLYIN